MAPSIRLDNVVPLRTGMSTSNNELKETLDKLVEHLLVLVYGKYEVMPNDAKPEAIWTMLAEMTNGIFGVCRRLAKISDKVSPNMILEGISKDASDEAAQANSIIKGIQRSSRISRNASFDDERRHLSLPRTGTDPKHAARILHEMIFVESDCFLSLSYLQPGSHGWVIVFRDQLKDWLLSTVEPFHVLYEDRYGKRTYFGIYTARMLPRASMNGAEFACLNDTVREVIITALSRSDRGSEAYNTTKENLLFSLKTLPCIFLQCIEFLPVTYRNFMSDVGRLVQPVPMRVAPPRPPGLPSPVKRGRQNSTLPSQVHADVSRKSSHLAQDLCVQYPQPADNDKTPRAQVATLPTYDHVSSVIFSATSTTVAKDGSVSLSSCDSRQGNSLKKASAGHQIQNWRKDQSDTSAKSGPNPMHLGPQPLQPSMRNNYQPCNLQPGMVPTPQIPKHFLQASSSSSSATTYRAPRGYQVQNQNINPIRNPLIGKPQIAGLSRGLAMYQPNGSLYPPAGVLSQHFPHETAGPRFYDSQSYRAQRMR